MLSDCKYVYARFCVQDEKKKQKAKQQTRINLDYVQQLVFPLPSIEKAFFSCKLFAVADDNPQNENRKLKLFIQGESTRIKIVWKIGHRVIQACFNKSHIFGHFISRILRVYLEHAWSNLSFESFNLDLSVETST